MYIKKRFKACAYLLATVIIGGNFAYVKINPYRDAHPWIWSMYKNYSSVFDFCKAMILIVAVHEILFKYKRCNKEQVDFLFHSEHQDRIMSGNLNMPIDICNNFSGNEKNSTSNHYSKTIPASALLHWQSIHHWTLNMYISVLFC